MCVVAKSKKACQIAHKGVARVLFDSMCTTVYTHSYGLITAGRESTEANKSRME